MTEAKYASEVIFTKSTPYLPLTGKLWGVFCEQLGENWSHNNSTQLNSQKHHIAASLGSVMWYLLPVWRMVYIHPLSLLCSTDYHEIWGGIKGPSFNMAQIYLFLISTHMYNTDTKSCHAQVAQDTEMWKYNFLFNWNLNWLNQVHITANDHITNSPFYTKLREFYPILNQDGEILRVHQNRRPGRKVICNIFKNSIYTYWPIKASHF